MKQLLNNAGLLCITTFMIVITSCKKYEDGPLFSLYSKEHRVVGEWDVEYFEINGFDSTTRLQNLPLNGLYSFSKTKDGRAGFSYNSYNHSYGGSGEWQFVNNKKSIEIKMDYAVPYSTYFTLCLFDTSRKMTWDIKRLTEKEMWLKNNYNDGREYFVKFKLFKNY